MKTNFFDIASALRLARKIRGARQPLESKNATIIGQKFPQFDY